MPRLLTVKVKPNSPETKILSQTDTEITLAVSEPAEQNKANIEVIKFLSKHFKAKVEIIRGLSSRKKIARISQ